MTDQRQDLDMRCPNPPINLFAKASKSPNGVEWLLDLRNPPVQSKARVDLAPHSGEHEIVVHLLATQGLEIGFDTTDPIWVCEGQQCPPPRGINTQQISVLSCTGNKLTLRDKNEGDACTLTYQLNFTGACALDPEIRNGGGNIVES